MRFHIRQALLNCGYILHNEMRLNTNSVLFEIRDQISTFINFDMQFNDIWISESAKNLYV